LSTFHKKINWQNVVSLDVVHHYIRTGEWAPGRTEMKQAWTPSQLVPRTYFCWSGRDISAAAYLRNFFNDLGDQFVCSDRRNRVQPDWLKRGPDDEGFVFYDLTSFTSWFHEHVPFLRSVAKAFSGIRVYLVGEDLTLSDHDLGSLIEGYTDLTTDFATFVVNSKSVGMGYEGRVFTHQTAGFLGIPGNLITCTIAHGLAAAANYELPRSLQVPGDDVGGSARDEPHRRAVKHCASTLGSLQFDKVFQTPQLSLYLKRLVLVLGNSLDLAPMLIFPLLPYLINPDSTTYQSNRFRLPPRDRIHCRAASVIVAFLRDFWRHTGGNADSDSKAIILLFLRRIHDQVGLPQGAIFQGRLYGSDDPETDHVYSDISVKFPVDDDRCLDWNPDLNFASKYVTRMTIRGVHEVKFTEGFTSLSEGERIVVRNSKGWRFLEDMGYVEILGIPGEKIELVGSDARDAFLFAAQPPHREVVVLSRLETHQLIAAGVIKSPDAGSFEVPSRRAHFDPNMQSWRYRRYVDLDDPKSAGFYGKSRDWVNEGLANTRRSLSPEPEFELDY
jgi:hypothetical protein